MKNLPDIACEADRLVAQARADWIERVAFSAAMLCLVHCLALPIALAALPALSKALSLPENIHLWLLALAVPASTWALVSGGMGRATRAPLLLGAFGLMLLALGAIVFAQSAAETPVTVAGSLLLALAHVMNWRLRHARHRHG
ncbi:MAG: MerC domain-containing protein [Sphingomonas sp.]